MTRWLAFVWAAVLLCLPNVSLAAAGTFDDCVQAADPDLSIAACTALIEEQDRPTGELAVAHFNRANARFGLGQYDEAIADYDLVVRLAPDFSDAYNNRALALTELGRFALAIEDYDRALQLIDRAPSHIGRGSARASLGDLDGALQDYDAAIALEPGNAPAHLARAVLLRRMGRYLEAIESYDSVIWLSPDFAPGYVGRAEAFFSMQQYNKALADYERAVALIGDAMNARFGLGRAHCRLGETEAATAAFADMADLGSAQAMALQRALMQQNYYSAAIDGAFGPLSNAALAAYVADGCPDRTVDVQAVLDAGVEAYGNGYYEEAFAIWRPLAEQGNAPAQRLLGSLFQAGHGVPQDYELAARLYGLAAQQGDPAAQRRLAALLARGLGVEQDYAQAEHWLRAAAQGGDAEAQLALGAMLEASSDSPHDLIEAYAWYDLASLHEDQADEARERIVAQLTPEELAEAEAASDEIRSRVSSGMQ